MTTTSTIRRHATPLSCNRTLVGRQPLHIRQCKCFTLGGILSRQTCRQFPVGGGGKHQPTLQHTYGKHFAPYNNCYSLPPKQDDQSGLDHARAYSE